MKKLSACWATILVFNTIISFTALAKASSDTPYPQITDIFPPQTTYHTHGSNIIYFNNSLMTVWFQGDGERQGNEVAIKGALLSPLVNNSKWSTPFQIGYNGTGFPDTNPALSYTAGEKNDKIDIYWEKIYYHEWEGAEPRIRNADISKSLPLTEKSFTWNDTEEGKVLNIKNPDNFAEQVSKQLADCWPLKDGKFDPTNLTSQQKNDLYTSMKKLYETKTGKKIPDNTSSNGTLDSIISAVYMIYDTYVAADIQLTVLNPMSKYYNKGWETRCNPLTITLPNGKKRILLPLYADGTNISLVAYSDDNGLSWTTTPIVSRAGIQPSLVQTDQTCANGNKKIIAFLRNNGGLINLNCALYSYSEDNGATWSPASPLVELSNQGSSLNAIKLLYGTYKGSIALIYNPDNNRKILNLAISQDNGKTWKKRTLEKADKDSPVKYEYPSITQTSDGELYISFTHTGSPSSGDQTIGVIHINPSEIINEEDI